MIKVVIAAVIIILVMYGGWEIWVYWDQVSHDKDIAAEEEAKASHINEQSLNGMPYSLEKSYQYAKGQGVPQWRAWMKQYEQSVADPRRAWIDLDFMIAIAHDDPAEARRIYADVKGRIPESSPVYKRVKQLENTYK